jgi:hypothetical protein
MRKTAARAIGVMVAVVVGALVAPAQSGRVQTPSKGIAARSAEVDAKVADLTRNIVWHPSLADARAAAMKTGKPIFWMHMLGDLTGMT